MGGPWERRHFLCLSAAVTFLCVGFVLGRFNRGRRFLKMLASHFWYLQKHNVRKVDPDRDQREDIVQMLRSHCRQARSVSFRAYFCF